MEEKILDIDDKIWQRILITSEKLNSQQLSEEELMKIHESEFESINFEVFKDLLLEATESEKEDNIKEEKDLSEINVENSENESESQFSIEHQAHERARWTEEKILKYAEIVAEFGHNLDKLEAAFPEFDREQVNAKFYMLKRIGAFNDISMIPIQKAPGRARLWSDENLARLFEGIQVHDRNFEAIQKEFLPEFEVNQIMTKYYMVKNVAPVVVDSHKWGDDDNFLFAASLARYHKDFNRIAPLFGEIDGSQLKMRYYQHKELIKAADAEYREAAIEQAVDEPVRLIRGLSTRYSFPSSKTE